MEWNKQRRKQHSKAMKDGVARNGHWSQTVEGRKRLSDIAKARWAGKPQRARGVKTAVVKRATRVAAATAHRPSLSADVQLSALGMPPLLTGSVNAREAIAMALIQSVTKIVAG